jgi:hypothetical protein
MLLSQVSVVNDRFVPWIVNQESGTIPGWKLAPFTTLFCENAGVEDRTTLEPVSRFTKKQQLESNPAPKNF